MLVSKTARRYASALLQFAQEEDSVEETLEDMTLIHNTLEGSRELVAFLRSPVIRYDDKMEALEEMFSERAQKSTILFLKLLARKGRIKLLDQVTEAFREQYNRYAGIVEVDVFSASPLGDEQRENLHRTLEEKTGKKVNMTLSVDRELRGGLAVRIDDTVIDGTVKHKLEELLDQLTGGTGSSEQI